MSPVVLLRLVFTHSKTTFPISPAAQHHLLPPWRGDTCSDMSTVDDDQLLCGDDLLMFWWNCSWCSHLPLFCSSRTGVSRSDDHLSAARPRRHDRGSARTEVHQGRLGHRPIQGQDRSLRRNHELPRWWVDKSRQLTTTHNTLWHIQFPLYYIYAFRGLVDVFREHTGFLLQPLLNL